jgi:hypothetical protein
VYPNDLLDFARPDYNIIEVELKLNKSFCYTDDEEFKLPLLTIITIFVSSSAPHVSDVRHYVEEMLSTSGEYIGFFTLYEIQNCDYKSSRCYIWNPEYQTCDFIPREKGVLSRSQMSSWTIKQFDKHGKCVCLDNKEYNGCGVIENIFHMLQKKLK